MYAPDREEQAAKIKEKLGIPKDKKVILYAPTWRDDQSTKQDSMVLNLILMLTDFRKSLGMNMYCY